MTCSHDISIISMLIGLQIDYGLSGVGWAGWPEVLVRLQTAPHVPSWMGLAAPGTLAFDHPQLVKYPLLSAFPFLCPSWLKHFPLRCLPGSLPHLLLWLSEGGLIQRLTYLCVAGLMLMFAINLLIVQPLSTNFMVDYTCVDSCSLTFITFVGLSVYQEKKSF